MAALLDPQLRATYPHSGETFDAAGLVRFNREYAGRWRVTAEEIVTSGVQAVSRARVSDGTDTYYVASFANVAGNRIVELIEIWTDRVPPPRDP